MANTLIFIPTGGLANRMRALASAVNLSLQTGARIEAVWHTGWGLQARYYDIFEPIPMECITLRDATWIDGFTRDSARAKNLFLPALYQRIVCKKVIKDVEVTPLKQQNFDFNKWASEGAADTSCSNKLLMSCYQVFGEFEDYDALIRRMFHPSKVVMDKVNAFREMFSSHTIGLHVRRTDSTAAIAESPLQLFIDAADKEIWLYPDTKIFLATDDEPTKEEMRQRYGDRIITPTAAADRESLEGIIGGLVDMWTLAATDVIYGSSGSSFSPMAATIGNKPLVIMKS